MSLIGGSSMLSLPRPVCKPDEVLGRLSALDKQIRGIFDTNSNLFGRLSMLEEACGQLLDSTKLTMLRVVQTMQAIRSRVDKLTSDKQLRCQEITKGLQLESIVRIAEAEALSNSTEALFLQVNSKPRVPRRRTNPSDKVSQVVSKTRTTLENVRLLWKRIHKKNSTLLRKLDGDVRLKEVKRVVNELHKTGVIGLGILKNPEEYPSIDTLQYEAFSTRWRWFEKSECKDLQFIFSSLPSYSHDVYASLSDFLASSYSIGTLILPSNITNQRQQTPAIAIKAYAASERRQVILLYSPSQAQSKRVEASVVHVDGIEENELLWGSPTKSAWGEYSVSRFDPFEVGNQLPSVELIKLVRIIRGRTQQLGKTMWKLCDHDSAQWVSKSSSSNLLTMSHFRDSFSLLTDFRITLGLSVRIALLFRLLISIPIALFSALFSYENYPWLSPLESSKELVNMGFVLRSLPKGTVKYPSLTGFLCSDRAVGLIPLEKRIAQGDIGVAIKVKQVAHSALPQVVILHNLRNSSTPNVGALIATFDLSGKTILQCVNSMKSEFEGLNERRTTALQRESLELLLKVANDTPQKINEETWKCVHRINLRDPIFAIAKLNRPEFSPFIQKEHPFRALLDQLDPDSTVALMNDQSNLMNDLHRMAKFRCYRYFVANLNSNFFKRSGEKTQICIGVFMDSYRREWEREGKAAFQLFVPKKAGSILRYELTRTDYAFSIKYQKPLALNILGKVENMDDVKPLIKHAPCFTLEHDLFRPVRAPQKTPDMSIPSLIGGAVAWLILKTFVR